MRKYCAVLLLVLTMQNASAVSNDVDEETGSLYGQRFYPGYLCDECRDPDDYPMDFAAFAYNGYFGDNPWMRDTQTGWPFRVYNLDGKWVVIWFEGVLFDAPSLLPDLMEVMIRKMNGQILEFVVLQNSPDLPIGQQGVITCSCAGSGGDGDGDGDGDDYDDYDEIDEVEFEEPEYDGVVEIVDPDDDDQFPEWYEEL